jgi:hypothetical protein
MEMYEIRALLEGAATPEDDDSKEAKLLRIISAALLGITEHIQAVRAEQQQTELLLENLEPAAGEGSVL